LRTCWPTPPSRAAVPICIRTPAARLFPGPQGLQASPLPRPECLPQQTVHAQHPAGSRLSCPRAHLQVHGGGHLARRWAGGRCWRQPLCRCDHGLAARPPPGAPRCRQGRGPRSRCRGQQCALPPPPPPFLLTLAPPPLRPQWATRSASTMTGTT
jgi:hypothetical protein